MIIKKNIQLHLNESEYELLRECMYLTREVYEVYLKLNPQERQKLNELKKIDRKEILMAALERYKNHMEQALMKVRLNRIKETQ